MKKRPVLLIFLLLSMFLVTLSGLYFFFQGNEKHNWNITYKYNGSEPFDLDISYQLLNKYLPKEELSNTGRNLEKYITNNINSEPSNFVVIGDRYNIGDSGVQTLLRYIRRGNSVYISTTQIPYEIIEKIFYSESNELTVEKTYSQSDYENPTYTNYSLYNLLKYTDSKNDSITVFYKFPQFSIPGGFTFRFFYRNQYDNYLWRYIDTFGFGYLRMLDTNDHIRMNLLAGIKEEKPTFLRFSIGKGTLYLNSTPLLFTNIFMKESMGFEYVTRFYNYIVPRKTHWETNLNRSNLDNNRENLYNDTPLRFFLSQQPLRWAWYVSLFLLLLFILFRSKRRERVIPVLPVKTNTSLLYYTSIARLFFNSQDHGKIAKMLQRHFVLYVLRRFRIHVFDTNQEVYLILAKRANSDPELAKKLIEQVKAIDNEFEYFSKEQLEEFYINLQKFYNSK